MTEASHGSIHALSGAYVVDALDDAERMSFEGHLPGCHDCQVEVAGLREAAAVLAEEAALAPPAALRARVLADISKVRPLPPETEATVVPLRRHRLRWITMAAAAVVLAIVGVGAVVQPWRDEARPTPAEQVMAASDATHVKVTLADGSSATVVRSVSEGKAVLVTRGMKPAPDGKVYELWLQNPQGTMVPAGLMTGSGDRTQLLEGDAAHATAAAISVEPSGGSRAPTSEPIALFDFKQT